MAALPYVPTARNTVPVLAPFGGDADAVRSVLDEDDVPSEACANAAELYARIDEHALLLVITEEGLTACSNAELGAHLRAQPIWSDIPIIALTGSKSAPSAGSRLAALAELGNVTMIHRPVSREALRMAFDAARRSRLLQYQVRDQLRALAGHADELERRVEERSAALAHEIEERKRAEAALLEARRMESLGRLTGGVAHDVNNLLQVVSGGVELLRMLTRTSDNERIERALNSIGRATGKGAKLTQQLLAYGRRQPLAATAIDLHAQLGELGDLLRHSLGGAIALDIQAEAGLWPIQADPTQLEVALLNLAINARDAMPRGGTVTLTLDNRSLPDPRHPDADADAALPAGQYVCLALADEGSGMNTETAANAFEPFFTTKPAGLGTGLGLSQVQGFARQSGGHAYLEQRAGGLTVGMLLPRAAAAPCAKPAAVEAGAGLPPGLRVLCVEDDAMVRELAVALLQALGCEVVQADSGDAALALGIDGIDVVLSDVMMPGSLDGIGLAAALRARHPRLPIVLASGYVLAPERLQDLALEFIPKPYTLKDIKDAIMRARQWGDKIVARSHVKLDTHLRG
jgi:signal transduction histidine kinase